MSQAQLKLKEMEEQMKHFQAQMETIKSEIKESEATDFDGPDFKIDLLISDKVFSTSSAILLNKKHGITLFIDKYNQIYNPGSSSLSSNNIKGSKSKNNNDNDTVNVNEKEGLGGKDLQVTQLQNVKSASNIINNKHNNSKHLPSYESSRNVCELYFDRNPSCFGIILDYLRGYKSIPRVLEKLNLVELEQLRDDSLYYHIIPLYELVLESLNHKFDDSRLKGISPMIKLCDDNTCAIRTNENVNTHQSVSLYGIIDMPSKGKLDKYVEFNVLSHGSRYIMIGITEARPSVKLAPYPGHGSVSGFSLYGANGHLYRLSGNEGWSGAWTYGDIIGMHIELDKDGNKANLTYYQNRKIVKNKLNINQYMNIDNGIAIIVNMYSNGDMVSIVQNPLLPK